MIEVWWVSPALVAIGLVVSVVAGMRREAKHAGVVDQVVADVGDRLDRHSSALNDLQDARIDHGERLSALESWRREHGTNRTGR